MLIGKPPDIPSFEITPKSAYDAFLNRRRFLRRAAAMGAVALGAERVESVFHADARVLADATKLQTMSGPLTTTGEQLTSFEDITHYNNYYEFGVNKGDPAKNAGSLPTRPWSVKIEGKLAKPLTFDIDTLLKLCPLEDCVYRHRCVEARSMVIPWVGYPLSELIKQCQPLSSAKFVQFLSYYNRGVEGAWAYQTDIMWPYSEGLRMDEAMNPLALLTFGLYGQTLPNQDGAPIRVVLPWKYGFKSAKSIVKIRFVEKMPHTTWNDEAPTSTVSTRMSTPTWTIPGGARRRSAASAFLFISRSAPP